ncbi:MAG: glycoside hydrolase family 5 protein [Robiginitomaculum sp.]|nr:glycoside hydrolase family 5 protein [Robiginitomaculum sp.]
MKTIFYIVVAVGFMALGACERTEMAMVEETPPDVTPAITGKIRQNANTIPVIKIEAGGVAQQEPTITPMIMPAHKQQKTVKKSKITRPNKSVRSTPFKVRRCMNMGNALEAPNEGDWGYRITAQDLRTVAAAGFDTVRIPIRWDAHTAHRAPYTIDASFMARIKTVVRDAQATGLGVIINVHHYEDLMAHPKREQKRFLAIWDQIARTFSGAPDTVYFEVLNEPTRQLSNAQVNALYAKVLPIIRATNPARKVILGGNSWNSIDSLAEVRWPLHNGKRDANLVATFHDYGPHAFTHQGAEWSEPVMPMGRRWGGQADMSELRDTYKLAREFKAKTDLPIFVGEFGVIDKVPLAQRNQWIKTRRKAMEQAGYAWCAWDFSGAFKSYDTQAGKWLPGTKDALFGR